MRRAALLCALACACSADAPKAPSSHPPSYDSPPQVSFPPPPADGWDLIPIRFTITDAESDAEAIVAEWSIGGQTFRPATGAPGQKLTKIPSSKTGVTSRFLWDSRADVGDQNLDGVVFRITASDRGGQGSGLSTGFSVHNALYVTQATAGDPGATIEVSGHGFGSDGSQLLVRFPGPLAATVGATPTDSAGDFLHVIVPAGVVAGSLTVEKQTLRSNPAPWSPAGGARFEQGPLGPTPSTIRPTLGDVDGDGDVDVIQGAIWRNTGAGNFTAIGPALSGRALVGDLDGDGRTDLVELVPGAEPKLLLQHTAGVWTAGTIDGSGATGPKSDAALLDSNGDGLPDLIVCQATPDGHAAQWVWFIDRLTPWVEATLTASSAERITVAGNQLVLGGPPAADLLIATGGTFTRADAFGYHGPIANQLALLADVDGDGIADLVSSAPLGLDLGLGSAFVPASGLYAAVDPLFATVADVNDDGRLDVYAVAPGRTYLFLATAAGWVESAAAAGLQPPTQPSGAVAADLDGDGRLDLYDGEHIYWNRSPLGNGSVEVTLAGHWAGARLVVTLPDGTAQVRWVESSALPVHFGMGAASQAQLEVDWADGKKTTQVVERGQRVTVTSS